MMCSVHWVSQDICLWIPIGGGFEQKPRDLKQFILRSIFSSRLLSKSDSGSPIGKAIASLYCDLKYYETNNNICYNYCEIA
jgi:hypothetical protein